LKDFSKQKDKFSVAFSDSFTQRSYYVASACNEIHVQPSGSVELVGFMSMNLRVKSLLEKIGVVPRLEGRHEYKSAGNIFTEKELTQYEKEEINHIFTSLYHQLTEQVSANRNIPISQVNELVESGPFMSQEAQSHKLVDYLSYKDQVISHVTEKAGDKAQLISLSRYCKARKKQLAKADKKKEDVIALVYAVGNVQRGVGDFGAEDVCHVIKKAADDPKVKAIVFRIDSRGGDYIAADRIWREVTLAQQKGKPVIASFGNVAASGGYFVATSCDHIVSDPATITGSIGVIAGKFVFSEELQQKVGVKMETIPFGKNSNMFSPFSDFSPEQKEKFDTVLDKIYQDFTDKVKAGRKLTDEQVDKLARGRVFTGDEAHKLGLVDSLGGLQDAVHMAKKLAKQKSGEEQASPPPPPKDDFKLVIYPKPKTTYELISENIFGESGAGKKQEYDEEDRQSQQPNLPIGFLNVLTDAIKEYFTERAMNTNVLKTKIDWDQIEKW